MCEKKRKDLGSVHKQMDSVSTEFIFLICHSVCNKKIE